LHGDTCAEQEREDGHRFEFEYAVDEDIDETIGASGIGVGSENMFEERDAKEREKVDNQDSEERETTEDVDRSVALGWPRGLPSRGYVHSASGDGSPVFVPLLEMIHRVVENQKRFKRGDSRLIPLRHPTARTE
jgi:hypothetical protein